MVMMFCLNGRLREPGALVRGRWRLNPVSPMAHAGVIGNYRNFM
jgi:hypothetical protein